MNNSYIINKKEQVENIRREWAISDRKRDEGLTTPKDIRRFDDIPYREPLEEDSGINENANLLDVYVQKDVNEPQPTIVNVHGGAFVYGNKEIYQYYCMQLALRGFTVVNINYRIAPESLHPAALEDVNSVLHFIEANGDQYFIDKNQLFLIGDSAGAQIVSHYAAIFTNPEYANLYRISVPKVQIKALGLNCGLYDMKAKVEQDPDNMFFFSLDQKAEELSREEREKLDVFSHMTSKYPPSFVMSAVNDMFLEEAKTMYQQLQRLNISSVLKIYGTKEQKEIAHIFHVNCKIPLAKICNDEECEFFYNV